MTLQELIELLPPELRPFGAEYGPIFLGMGIEQLKDILALLLAGDSDAAYDAALQAMTPEQLDAETRRFTEQDALDAANNAASVEQQRQAAKTAATILFSIVLALVGL